MDVCVLGSGSSGNSTLVRAGSGGSAGAGGVFLVDAGFGPRVTQTRLAGTGVGLTDISAIVLTHLDSDHFNANWLLTILKQGLKVHVARGRYRDFMRLPEVRDLLERQAGMLADFGTSAGPRRFAHRLEDLIVPFGESFEPVPGVAVEALHLPHDEAGSHGFVIRSGDYGVGYATDLGHVPAALIERFRGMDVLAIESNYDPYMEEHSARPWYLKQRIMGGSGHLSNEQAMAAVRAILDQTLSTCGPDRLPRHIVLLHRSRQCNCPKLVKRLFTADPRIGAVLTLTHQQERTDWLYAKRGRAQHVEQLTMAWG